MTTERLAGKVLVITGGASGIGAACARRYAREGGSVVVADISPRGADIANELSHLGGSGHFVETDVAKPEALERLLEESIRRYGHVDVWHNNAFSSVFKPLAEQTLEEFDRTIQVSLRAYWYGSKLAVTHMLERDGGLILHTASVQSYRGEKGFSAYQCAKGGILSLARSIALDHAPTIRSVAVAPGFIHTPAHDLIPAETIEKVTAGIPANRGAEPSEVAALCAYLASDEAAYITGTGIVIDGGYLAS